MNEIFTKFEPNRWTTKTLTPSLSSGKLWFHGNFPTFENMMIDSCFAILDELVNLDRRKLISRYFSWNCGKSCSALIQAYLTDPGTIPDALVWRNFVNFGYKVATPVVDLTNFSSRKGWRRFLRICESDFWRGRKIFLDPPAMSSFWRNFSRKIFRLDLVWPFS